MFNCVIYSIFVVVLYLYNLRIEEMYLFQIVGWIVFVYKVKFGWDNIVFLRFDLM